MKLRIEKTPRCHMAGYFYTRLDNRLCQCAGCRLNRGEFVPMNDLKLDGLEARVNEEGKLIITCRT